MVRIAILASVVVATAAFACGSSSSGADSRGGGDGGGGGANGGGARGGDGSSAPSFGETDAATSGESCTPSATNAEIAGNNCDDDGDGKVDNVASCDSGLAVDGPADAFAKAIGICDTASSRGFGLVSASYTRAYGSSKAPSDGQWGILPKFGTNVKAREGSMLGVLSSGYAREWDSLRGSDALFVEGTPLNYDVFSPAKAPPGFPKPASGCPQADVVNDMIVATLVLKAPPNAKGFTFDFDFYSSEWPGYICSSYNDSFIAYLSAQGFNKGAPDNISFDSKNNPVSVNNGFFDRCTPNSPTGCKSSGSKNKSSIAPCAAGEAELAGTGYGEKKLTCDRSQPQTVGGATGWLTTQAPVNPGEQFTIAFMIWDTEDSILDSSVLLDNFKWVGGEVTTNTTRPPR